MNSYVNKLYPLYRLWAEGWRDFFTGLRLFNKARVYQSLDGRKQCWARGQWAPSNGAVQGFLLDPHKVLLRRIVLPVLPLVQIQTAVAAEVLVSSPFPADITVSGFSCTLTNDGRMDVEVAMLHRRELDAAGASMAIYAPGKNGPIPVLVKQDSMGAVLAWILWGGVGMLLAIGLMAPLLYSRQQTVLHIQAFDRFQQKTAQLQNQREMLQMQHAQYQQLLAFRENHPDPLLVLERISAGLPDASYLVQFSLKEQQISMEGQTSNALTLLNQLQGVQGLSNVQLSGAVQRHPQTGKDIFQMQMRFQP